MRDTGLGDARPITSTVGGTLVTIGGVLMLVPAVGPLVGGIVAAVGALTSLVGGLFKPDLTKIEASNIVDQIEEQVLKPLRATWDALTPDQKTTQAQSAALAVFDQAWSSVLQGCGNPALGTAGQACIADRQQGACHYTLGGATPGTSPDCGNWFSWYRDPIQNDPAVHDAGVTGPVSGVESAVQDAFQSGSPVPLLLAAGVALWVLAS